MSYDEEEEARNRPRRGCEHVRLSSSGGDEPLGRIVASPVVTQEELDEGRPEPARPPK